MEIQLAQIYNSRKINLPNVQQQLNSVDCGVFAIAFLVMFCENGFTSITETVFDTQNMREHFASCLENNFFVPFPKKGKKS